MKRSFQKGPILGFVGIVLTLAIMLSGPLVLAQEERQEPESVLIHLAERAERGELTVRQLYEALGRPLGALPREVWDNKVVGGPVGTGEARRVRGTKTEDPLTRDYPAPVPAGIVHFIFWSWQYLLQPNTVVHGSIIQATDAVFYMGAISELIGPKGNRVNAWGLFQTEVEAWDMAFERPWGLYKTKGTHHYWDPFLHPVSQTWHTVTDTLLVPH